MKPLPPPKPLIDAAHVSAVVKKHFSAAVKAERIARGKPANHRKNTGNPKGGPQPGAGRPKGSKNRLGPGSSGLKKKLYHLKDVRLPENVTEPERRAANRAMIRILQVMEGEVPFPSSGVILKAATQVREEICGLATRNINFKGEMTWARALEETEEEQTALPGEVVDGEVLPPRSDLPEDMPEHVSEGKLVELNERLRK